MQSFKRLLASLCLLFAVILPLGAWTLFDDFESHIWYSPYWEDPSIQRQMQPSWGTYQGRNCLKLTGPEVGGYEPIITNFFAGEDWSHVTSIKLDIYTETNPITTTVKLEPRQQNDALCVNTPAFLTMSTGTWTTYSWNYAISASSPVAKLQLIFADLGTNAATFYVDNLRLVLDDDTTHYWDNFDDNGHPWGVAGSAALWNAAPSFISHNASTSTVNGSAGLLWWNYSGPATAELQTAVSSLDWSASNTIRADVRCSTTTIPIKCYCWYGTRGEATAARYVSSPDTWQTLYWQLPEGTTVNAIQGFNILLEPSALLQSGTFYIDNISIGDVDITVVKSTDIAVARPGDEVTCTIRYANSGADSASNLYINDTVPFNSSISAAANNGSADSVEYFVSGSWTSTYNEAATRIRWKDTDVAAGPLSVSYKLKIK